MPLTSISSSLYSDVHTIDSYDGYIMLFDVEIYELLHSSYFGGLDDDEIMGISVNNFNEIFTFGFTESVYNDLDYGIPVNNNEMDGTWYQDNLAGEADLDGFIFKWCLDGTPLNADSDLIFESQLNEIEIYPNPFSANRSDLTIISQLTAMCSLNLYSYEGRLIKQVNNLNLSNTNSVLEISTLDPGMYLLEFRFSDKVVTKKLTVID